MKLGSEGVYLHEKCGTNPSRYLPGLKMTVQKLKMPLLGSGIMKLGSEGVYLHEKCGTNPSRHLPGLKTAIKN